MNGKVTYILVLVFSLSAVLTGCATISPAPAGIEIVRDVKLPVTVEKVWYRTEKVRLLGLAYEESGIITIDENSIEFVYKNGDFRIPREKIQKVAWGKLSPDIANDWIIVYYTISDRSEVAAFKGAVFSGGGKDSKIYSAILHIMKDEK